MVKVFGWKIIPAYGGYALIADRFVNHPRLGSGPSIRTSLLEVVNLREGFAVTRSGTHYDLCEEV